MPSAGARTPLPAVDAPIAAPTLEADGTAWAGPRVPVPILYQHRVLPLPPDIGTWTASARKGFLETDTLPWAVEAQLDWLLANGYHTILPRDLVAHWDRGAPLPIRPVILSFDDGYGEWLSTLLPMLVRHGMVAELYVTLDALASGHLTWADIRTLAAAGMGIGAHDVHHVQLAMLGSGRKPASLATMTSEVTEARRILGAQLGTPPDSMAYVGGGFDASLVAAVQKAGYTSARALIRGVVQSPDQRWTLHVSRISVWDDVLDQAGCLAAPSEATCALDAGLPTFARRVSGEAPG
jgi:peptidoglycan/xylan/chitin deacetylase (PgdA/CDA1 family)